MRATEVRLSPARAGRGVLFAVLAIACSSAPDPDAENGSTPMVGGGGTPAMSGAPGSGGSMTPSGGSNPTGGSGGTSAGSGPMGGSPSGGTSGGPGQGGSAMGGHGGGSGGVASGGGSAGAGGSMGGGGAPETSVYPPAAGAGDTAAAIAQLNLYRTALGLSQITLDDASSVGCEGHLLYLIEEADRLGQQGYLEHTESNHQNSHYSAANEAAGKSSDLAWGQSGGPGGVKGQSLGQAVDLWINGVYHRRPLLDPGLVKVGAASNQGYNCFNYNASGNTTVKKIDHPVLWPADGMTDVPRAFGGNEGPCPTNPADPLNATSCAGSGFIISAVWYNWGTNRASALTSVASVTLTNSATQADVPLLTWYADGVSGHDPAHGYMQDELALVPQASLAANTTYQVDVDAVVSGTATKLSWSFKTGSRSQ
jgi:uncharacterized protein YkwD